MLTLVVESRLPLLGELVLSSAVAPVKPHVTLSELGTTILLRENGFPELYKPAGESFDACAEGLLLQVSPWDYHMEKRTITRDQCLELNALAERIAGLE